MIHEKIRAVAFDAVGTLIEPCPGVARAYAMAAAEQGVELPEDLIRGRFAAAFARDGSASGYRTDEDSERIRWRGIVADCLPELGTERADAAFAKLWDHFADPRNWRLFPDVADVFKALADDGLKLCVASNFDSRLRRVWDGLTGGELPVPNLVISSEVGVRKPGSGFYRVVTRVLECPPASILFVGDDYDNDYRVPREEGFDAVLVDRRGRSGEAQCISKLSDLLRLPETHG